MKLYEFDPKSLPANCSTGAESSEEIAVGLRRLRNDAIRHIVESYMRAPQPLKPEQVTQMSDEIVAATEPFARLIYLATAPRSTLPGPSLREEKES